MNSEKHMSNLRDELSNTIALKDKQLWPNIINDNICASFIRKNCIFDKNHK